jgi:hypothetical protein
MACAVETAASMEIEKGGLRRFLLDDFHRCLEKPPQKTALAFPQFPQRSQRPELPKSGEPNQTQHFFYSQSIALTGSLRSL